MKSFFFLLLSAVVACAAQESSVGGANAKVYECPYIKNPPYGVAAWSQSSLIKDAKNRESRFVGYDSDAAQNLILDAAAERDVTRDEAAPGRNTFFAMAYNEKGWSIYVQCEEPLARSIVDNLVNPKSPGRNEALEVFFAPGMSGVPYYQLLIKTFVGTSSAKDWGMPHRHYRLLDQYVKIESLPLENGVGTFVFIPWEALYERIPVNGDTWRFTVIRWMPTGKAGGVTWGGKVHDTGNFGRVHFQPVTAEQKLAFQKRMLRIGWFKYLATSSAATTQWSDEKLGDPIFYTQILKPEIEASTAAGQALGDPDNWTVAEVEKGMPNLENWMEFGYKVSELRSAFLVNKRFSDNP